MSAVTLTGVTKYYGSHRVLDAVDLHVPDGSITSVLGASGCGKTTLLRIVAGFVDADSGVVALGDRVVHDGSVTIAPERRGVGYVPQEGALFPHLDVAANITFGIPRRDRSAGRLAELLDLAELPAELARRHPFELSGGQQQRVAIARALAARPRVILLDEPFSSLDAALRISAGKAVTRVLRAAGATALIVTHDQGEALSLADQVAVMRAGRFVQVADPVRLYEHPVDAQTAEFVGGASILAAQILAGTARTAAGEIAVDAADGPGQVLIRPEQVLLLADGSTGAGATVTEVGFYGAQVVVSLALADGTRLISRAPSVRTPRTGDVVRVVLEGSGVVYGMPS